MGGALIRGFDCKESGREKTILTALCGHGHLDLASYDRYLRGEMKDLELSDDVIKKAMLDVPEIA